MRIKFVLTILSISIVGGCMSAPYNAKKAKSPTETNARAKALLEEQKHEAALEILQPKPKKNAETYYLIGCAYGLKGDIENVIVSYQKALQIKADYHTAYIALRTIYEESIFLQRAHLEDINAKKAQVLHSGEGDLQVIETQLQQQHREQAQLFISQAETYLLYDHPPVNITEFPSIDAHLRDMQDIFVRKVPPHTDSLAEKIWQARHNITKKYVRTLIADGQMWAAKKDYTRAIDSLKEADDQLAKFYLEERPTGKNVTLKADDQVLEFTKTVAQHLALYYEKLIAISRKNYEQFQRIQNAENAEEQNLRVEELIESWIQSRITYMWRLNKLPREKAEEHEEMIPLYQKFLQFSQDSPKVGEYHFRLARCYLRQGQHQQAKFHANKAQELLGSYRVKEFLQTLSGNRE